MREADLKKIYLVEVFNSLAWFSMDALWMMNHQKLAYLFGIPTVVTGVLAIVYSRSRVDKYVNLTIFFWIMMNISWLLGDIYPWMTDHYISTIFFFLALTCIFITLIVSEDYLEAFSKLRKLRISNPLIRGQAKISK